jgi:hypothetical protein
LVSFDNGNSNFLHGHWNNNRGVAYYEKWLTNNKGIPFNNGDGNTSDDDMTKWLVMCGKNDNNSGSKNNDIIVDGISKGTGTNGEGGQNSLNINLTNNSYIAENSDFAFNQLIVFDTVLSDDEMKIVSDYLQKYLRDGNDETDVSTQINDIKQIEGNRKITFGFKNNNNVVHMDKNGIKTNQITLGNKVLTEKLINHLIRLEKIKPLFNVYKGDNGRQSIEANTLTRVDFHSERFNVLGRYLKEEKYFNPALHAGYYQINVSVKLPNINTGYVVLHSQYGNINDYSVMNVEIARGSTFSGNPSPDTTLVLSTIVYLNGDDEKVYVMIKCSPATTIPDDDRANSFFSGHFIQEHIGNDDPNAQYKQ